MLYTVMKQNLYQDSVSLMLLTNHLSTIDGVQQIQVMMGTPANKDIFKSSGLYTEELEKANPNDLCIVVNAEDEGTVDRVIEETDSYLSNQSQESQRSSMSTVRTWEMAENKLPNADVALISIAGEHVKAEANKALDRNLNVFIFSDNVSVDDELQLKTRAEEKGLIVMGPDCGTGILDGVPMAFANVVRKGTIGIVGASGTGIQEVSAIIGRKGGGISQAIGTGGRDISTDIGAITTIKSLQILEQDTETEVITFISKPPDPEVRDKIINVFKALSKPVVAIFMGDKPRAADHNIHYTWTLEDCAWKALELANASSEADFTKNADLEIVRRHHLQRYIKGYFCGGTLAHEAAMIMKDAFHLNTPHVPDGMMLRYEGHEVVDLGDDVYTEGRAHPMIDPTLRVEKLKEAARDPETAVILLDNVIGYGAHDDMAGIIASAIEEEKQSAVREGRSFVVIASVTGTSDDPQVYQDQADKLKAAGAMVSESNAQATKLAIAIIHYLNSVQTSMITDHKNITETDKVVDLIAHKPRVINVGLRNFAEAIQEHGGEVIQYQWEPIAGGNKRLANILEKLK